MRGVQSIGFQVDWSDKNSGQPSYHTIPPVPNSELNRKKKKNMKSYEKKNTNERTHEKIKSKPEEYYCLENKRATI